MYLLIKMISITECLHKLFYSTNTKFQAFNSVKTLGDSDVSPSYS